MEDLAKLFEAFAKLASALIWPATFIWLMCRYGKAIGEVSERFFDAFIASRGEMTVKAPGVEATLKWKQEAAAALTAATVAKTSSGEIATASSEEVKTQPVSKIENIFQEAAGKARSTVDWITHTIGRKLDRASGARILWVDDQPNNNFYERQAIEALGADFVTATSTENALRIASNQNLDLIISDMDRSGDPQAGYTLLEKLLEKGITSPLIIYSGSDSEAQRAEALNRGAVGYTNQPTELFTMVFQILTSR